MNCVWASDSLYSLHFPHIQTLFVNKNNVLNTTTLILHIRITMFIISVAGGENHIVDFGTHRMTRDKTREQCSLLSYSNCIDVLIILQYSNKIGNWSSFFFASYKHDDDDNDKLEWLCILLSENIQFKDGRNERKKWQLVMLTLSQKTCAAVVAVCILPCHVCIGNVFINSVSLYFLFLRVPCSHLLSMK